MALIQYQDVPFLHINMPIVETRWSSDHRISTMGIPILVISHMYIEATPSSPILGLLKWQKSWHMKYSVQVHWSMIKKGLMMDSVSSRVVWPILLWQSFASKQQDGRKNKWCDAQGTTGVLVKSPRVTGRLIGFWSVSSAAILPTLFNFPWKNL